LAIEPVYTPIGRLFTQFIFQVPRYQRGYTWDDPQIDDFLRDFQRCFDARTAGKPRQHFFGGIVGVERKVSGSLYRRCDLIDGQQRIATFVLLARCLETAYQALAEGLPPRKKDDATFARNRAQKIRNEYLEHQDEINRRMEVIDRLKLSAPDQQLFSDILHGRPPAAVDLRDSHRRLQSALSAIQDKVDAVVSAQRTLPKQLDVLEVFERIVAEDCTVIHIVTDAESEAYGLFQVLNNRGTNLTEGDLLRASTLEMVSSEDFKNEHDSAAAMWDEVLSDHPNQTEGFLRWYYASVKGKRPGQSSLFDDFSEAFFPRPTGRPMTARGAKDVVKEVQAIRDDHRTYRKLVAGEWPYAPPNQANAWLRDRLRLLVAELDHTNCMPLLLAACQLDEKKFAEIVHLVERFAFRYKFVCNVHITPLTNVYMLQAQSIRANPAAYRVGALRGEFQRLQQERATDDLFRSLVEKISYHPDAGNKILRYFLTTAEHYWRWYREGAAGAPKCRDVTRIFDVSSITMEHIYPQNPPPGARDPQLDLLVNSLGNMTFLGPRDNDKVANADFPTKKPVFAQSAVLMNQQIATLAAWTAADVQNRQRDLTDLALKVFTA
jgi:hypothetical protein